MQNTHSIRLLPARGPLSEKILNPEALKFLKELHTRFNSRRLELLKARTARQSLINKGEMPDFLPETKHIREDLSWKVAPIPPHLKKRFVEITGPTDRKMVINALNSGADVFMADFEDANSPTWENLIEGQNNLIDAVNKTLSLTTPEGKSYRLHDTIATLFVRPRGWHLPEKHLLIDGEEMSGSLFDFGLFIFHNHKNLKNPAFYLPKIESHLEARLWKEVFAFTEERLSIPKGSIRATVLIETILAAFEMEEILFELKEYSAGLNAGRWDYIFSIIKKFQSDKSLIFPDRQAITMTVPFMQAYCNLLVYTCHKRGAHAMGGMAAFIPNRKDPEVTELALKKVSEDKLRECKQGFDGTWVAHPDLVPFARDIFIKHWQEKAVADPKVSASSLLNFSIENAKMTKEGLEHNLSIALEYLHAWLEGKGAVALHNLMEDAATAEISRSQCWQWLQRGKATKEEIIKGLDQEEKRLGPSSNKARKLLEEIILSKEFVDFLTLPAYKELS